MFTTQAPADVKTSPVMTLHVMFVYLLTTLNTHSTACPQKRPPPVSIMSQYENLYFTINGSTIME